MNVTTDICNAFHRHAKEYERAAKIQQEIGDRLFERLDYLKIDPGYVLDLGCGPGGFIKRLKKYYPKAIVVGLDLAYGMWQEAKAKSRWRAWPLVNGDMMTMPFADGVFDLVFANQVIHWSSPLSRVVGELNRVMAPDGCLMFSTLGPDTFRELRAAWSLVDDNAHVNDFMDLHDVGDCLLAEYFLDPVVDMEILTAHYSMLSDLLHALKAQGVRNIHARRPSGLMGKGKWRDFEDAMTANRTTSGQFPLTYEVVYGHAWKGQQRRTAKGVETVVSLDTLRRSSWNL